MNNNRKTLDISGTTLVELMVSTGLFSLVCLALASLFADHAKYSAKAQNDARLSESLLEFADTLETYLNNTTQVIACGCNSGGTPPCGFSEAVDCTTAGNCNNTALLKFETETSPTPDATSADGCIFPAANAILPGGVTTNRLMLRGCKLQLQLSYTPPTQVIGATPSQPGVLTLDLINPNTGAVARTLNQLPGVFSVKCGASSFVYVDESGANVNQLVHDQFKLDISVKTRASNLGLGDPSYESWHPLDTAFNFLRGTQRQIVENFAFRNLSVRGVMYGKAHSFMSCALDGQTEDQGNCCSGYRYATGLCMPMSACLGSGQTPADFAECCSHVVYGGTCL